MGRTLLKKTCILLHIQGRISPHQYPQRGHIQRIFQVNNSNNHLLGNLHSTLTLIFCLYSIIYVIIFYYIFNLVGLRSVVSSYSPKYSKFDGILYTPFRTFYSFCFKPISKRLYIKSSGLVNTEVISYMAWRKYFEECSFDIPDAVEINFD